MLGIVQGLTEFAPVSSSGHLILVPWLLGWGSLAARPDLHRAFDVALHVGTFVGAAAYLAADLVRYVRAFGRSVAHRAVRGTDERLAWLLVLGTIPSLLTGVLLDDVIERHLRAPWLIAVMLAVFGVVLYVVDRGAGQRRSLEDLRTRDAVVIGVAQALALQPGVSRSGVTITAARGLGLDRVSATRFSFLLSLPAIAGAGAYELVPLLSEGLPPGMAAPFAWGMAASAASGFAIVWGLLALVRRVSFAGFTWYRLAVAALALAAIAAGLRPAT